MRNFGLVVFRNEQQGLRGLSALERLDREGIVSLRGAALVERDGDGLLLVRKDISGNLLEGGLGATVARAPGDLLQFLAGDLAKKTFAVIAELGCEWTPAIGARMEPLGATLVCDWSGSAR